MGATMVYTPIGLFLQTVFPRSSNNLPPPRTLEELEIRDNTKPPEFWKSQRPLMKAHQLGYYSYCLKARDKWIFGGIMIFSLYTYVEMFKGYRHLINGTGKKEQTD